MQQLYNIAIVGEMRDNASPPFLGFDDIHNLPPAPISGGGYRLDSIFIV